MQPWWAEESSSFEDWCVIVVWTCSLSTGQFLRLSSFSPCVRSFRGCPVCRLVRLPCLFLMGLRWPFTPGQHLYANTTARHKYGVPGRYQAQVSLSAGHQEIVAQGNVSVELPPRLELHCPELIVANQSLEEVVSLVNWGGLGVTVDWRIRKDGREIARGTRQKHTLCSKTNIYKHIRMISEGSWDIEDWSNDAENSALHHRNKIHF